MGSHSISGIGTTSPSMGASDLSPVQFSNQELAVLVPAVVTPNTVGPP